MMRIKFEWQEEKNKILLMATLLAICCFFTYYYHVVLKAGTVFTHFFYIPIILASLWWKRKGLAVAIFLGVWLILSHFFIRTGADNINDLLRALMFIVVSLVTAYLSEKIWKAKEEIEKEKNFSENIITTVPDSLIVVDKDLRIKRVNLSFNKVFGLRPEKAIGIRIVDLLGDDKGKLITELTRLLGTKTVLENFELRYRSEKLGDRIFNIAARGIIVAENGEEEQKEVLIVIGDISERKRAEEELKKYREHLEELVEERTVELRMINERLQKEIEEHKRAEEAVKKERNFSKNIIATVPDSLLVLNKDLEIKSANRTFYERFQIKSERVIGACITDILGDGGGRLSVELSRLFGTDDMLENFELRYQTENIGLSHEAQRLTTRSERILDITARGIIIAEEEEEEEELLVVLQDITERKQAEEASKQAEAQKFAALEALLKSEEKYRRLIDQSGDAIYLLYEGRFEIINQRFKEIFGYTLEETNTPDFNFMKLVAPKSIDIIKERIKKVGKGEPVSPIYEFTAISKDGREIEVETSVSYIQYKGGIATQGILRDITERKQTEEELRKSEERYRITFESTGTATIIIEEDTTLSMVNSQFEKLSGYSKEEIEGKKSWTEFVLKDDLERMKEYYSLRRIDPDNVPRNYEFRYIDRNGNIKDIFLTVTMIKGTRKSIAALLDITERKQAEEAKQALEAQLLQSQKLESIGTLASGVAHEINNPLMGMINYAELIRSRIKDKSLAEFSKGIIEEGDRVAKIVRNLLSFARQDTESHSPANIKDIIDASISLLGSVLRKHQITLIVDISKELPYIKCRSQQIEQVIINLLTNAKDALNERYPDYDENKIVKISAKPYESDGAGWIRITVEDHGAGIPDDVADRIFDPFFTTKPRDVGTGLGLSVSYGLIKDHHGELSVESEPGKFTRFHIDLPVNNRWSVGD
jgi:PAS domain S-box-containing protein